MKLAFIALVVTGACSAQLVQSPPRTTTSFTGAYAAPRYIAPTVAGAPYSGEWVSERVQTLADGTKITQKQNAELRFRDSQGRTRTEHSINQFQKTAPRIVQIADPVAGFQYTLDPWNHVAHRVKVTAAPAPPRSVNSQTQSGTSASSEVWPSGRRLSAEALEEQSIEGEVCEGVRTSITIPEGVQGNDRAIVTTQEYWFSKDLRVQILSKTTDPRSGESTSKLTNLSRAEPDPLLFQIPADYKIVDETSEFTISSNDASTK